MSLFAFFEIACALILSAFFCKWLGEFRGHPLIGFVFGLCLPVIGWVIVLLLPDEGPRCPACMGVIHPGARKCCHCGESL